MGLAQAAFGGDNEFVALTDELVSQRHAEDAFGCAEPVRLGRVEEVDAPIRARAANRRDGPRPRRTGPSHPRAARYRMRFARLPGRFGPMSWSSCCSNLIGRRQGCVCVVVCQDYLRAKPVSLPADTNRCPLLAGVCTLRQTAPRVVVRGLLQLVGMRAPSSHCKAEAHGFASDPMRCLIVDDSADFVDAARGLLECEGITVVGSASTSAEALRSFEELRPDVTLVDINLGGESGFELAEQLHRAGGAVTGDTDLNPRRAGLRGT